ncbi:MAG: 50S ribosomal protein L40e [Nanoarchaeota archaeon]|nr:50S ribosomal protein L40e [Nanoarchaeota archaeon]MCA9497119.1 50S ribosomal protein L40e [Nanoarchaeota archaeon]
MAIFKEAENRLFDKVYICRKCESKTKIPISKVLVGKGVCRKCSGKDLRPVRKISKK